MNQKKNHLTAKLFILQWKQIVSVFLEKSVGSEYLSQSYNPEKKQAHLPHENID